jgi:hypothetical protein
MRQEIHVTREGQEADGYGEQNEQVGQHEHLTESLFWARGGEYVKRRRLHRAEAACWTAEAAVST